MSLQDTMSSEQGHVTLPAPLSPPPQAVATVQEMHIIEGEHRQLAAMSAEPSLNMQRVSNIAYSAVGAVVALFIAASFITLVVWFIADLRAIATTAIPASITDHTTYTRNEIINASLNLLANLVLVLVLVEVFSAIVNFIRLHRATARPIILIPLYIVMRAIVQLGSQLLLNPPTPDTGTSTLIVVLAEMGAFALVGLALSLALAALREPSPKDEAKK